MYAEVVFPLPFRNSFTYKIPGELEHEVIEGIRVIVPFGKRILTGFVILIKEEVELKEKIKPIIDVIDSQPIFDEHSLKFYQWISEYYLSSLGEALKNSVPYGTSVETKRKVLSDSNLCYELYRKEKNNTSIRSQILKFLSEHEECKISYLQKVLKNKNIYSILRNLEAKGVINIINEVEKAKVNIKTAKFVKLKFSNQETLDIIGEIERTSPKQALILLNLLSVQNNEQLLSELLKKTNASSSSVKGLVEKRIVSLYKKEIIRNYVENFTETKKDFELTHSQKEAVNSVYEYIENEDFTSFMLYGVTGSGKTQVYIELAKKVLAINKSVLIMVPEISLTPQITSRMMANFGDTVAVLHSRMSLGEKFDSWRNILNGKCKVVVGARSALFAPLKNIGLIVIDEEHDQSYKQTEQIPKYNAKDAGIMRAWFEKCPVILGSATPSIESMYNAKIGKHKLLELPERVDNAKLPSITLVNTVIERKKNRMEGIFSDALLKKIKERIEKKESVIIFQNRRGFATQIYCEDCGTAETCKDCSVGLVHHISKNTLQCHYCGFTKKVPKGCTTCGSVKLKFLGTGTQRVEDELEYYFPSAKIERIDSDSINKKGKMGLILNSFSKGEIDILVGTQMVAKGLDFPNVTLVAVIAAETSLWMPDFRADERTFQLLTQVSGRAGRSKLKGEVIIQTQDDKHFVLQKILENNYHAFYEREIKLRQQYGYPPFTKICLIEVKDKNQRSALRAINGFYKILLAYKKYLKIVPPSEAAIFKLKGEYRYQIVIKSYRENDPNGNLLRKAVLEAYIEFNKIAGIRNVKIYFDIDPQSIM